MCKCFHLAQCVPLSTSSVAFHVCTVQKVYVFRVFVIRIFPHLDQKNSEYGYFSRCIVLQSKTNDWFLYEIQHCCRALVNIEINMNIGRNDCMFLSCHSDVSEWIHNRLVWLNSWVFVYELSGCGLEPYWEKRFKITENRHYWVLSLACLNSL